MNKVIINGAAANQIQVAGGHADANGQKISWDVQALPDGTYSILANGKSYRAAIEQCDRAAKQLKLNVNGNVYEATIEDPIDQLLKKMGLNMANNKKVEAIKAPMPGLVLKILVTEGQAIKKGEPVLILEAMKMENVFKAPADAVVKAIKIVERKAVEKGEVLIELA
ncbi:MAG: biotin/lipoyl-binding protein [Edaphocola sp.]